MESTTVWYSDQVVTIVRFQFIKSLRVQWWLTRRGSLWRGSPGILCAGRAHVCVYAYWVSHPATSFDRLILRYTNVTRVKNDRVACHDTALAYPSKKLLANSGSLVTCFLPISITKKGIVMTRHFWDSFFAIRINLIFYQFRTVYF